MYLSIYLYIHPAPANAPNRVNPVPLPPLGQHSRWRSLMLAFSASFLTSLTAFLIPATASLRPFDWICLPNLSLWHWTLRPSLSYVGQGMVRYIYIYIYIYII